MNTLSEIGKNFFGAFIWFIYFFSIMLLFLSGKSPDESKGAYYFALIILFLVLVSSIILFLKKFNPKPTIRNIINYVIFGIFLTFSAVVGMADGAPPNSRERAKLSSLKANMHTIQTILETYAVDHGGTYPINLEVLYKEAQEEGYWKEFKNPYTEETGKDKAWMASPLPGQVKVNTMLPANFIPGAVIYFPVIEKGVINKYYVYGGDNTSGNVILDKGQPFFLTND